MTVTEPIFTKVTMLARLCNIQRNTFQDMKECISTPKSRACVRARAHARVILQQASATRKTMKPPYCSKQLLNAKGRFREAIGKQFSN
jgi:hypothetical protein